jgi:hypothetical protein
MSESGNRTFHNVRYLIAIGGKAENLRPSSGQINSERFRSIPRTYGELTGTLVVSGGPCSAANGERSRCTPIRQALGS